MSIASGLRGRSFGMILLALWLILTGLLPLINTRVTGPVATGMAVLAIVAGVLILAGR